MSDFSLTLVLRLKTSKIINDMSNVSIKSEKITPFGGIFYVYELNICQSLRADTAAMADGRWQFLYEQVGSKRGKEENIKITYI